MLTRGIPGIARLWQRLSGVRHEDRTLTAGTQPRLILTENNGQMCPCHQPGKYLSPLGGELCPENCVL